METETAARRWVETYAHAWPGKDSDAIAALYADDAAFRSQPFRETHVGPDGAYAYAEWTFSEQDEAECWFSQPIISGDRAVVEYWGVVQYQGGDETIAGLAVIRFRPDGLVAEQHDYWNAQEGRVEPPPGWGS